MELKAAAIFSSIVGKARVKKKSSLAIIQSTSNEANGVQNIDCPRKPLEKSTSFTCGNNNAWSQIIRQSYHLKNLSDKYQGREISKGSTLEQSQLIFLKTSLFRITSPMISGEILVHPYYTD